MDRSALAPRPRPHRPRRHPQRLASWRPWLGLEQQQLALASACRPSWRQQQRRCSCSERICWLKKQNNKFYHRNLLLRVSFYFKMGYDCFNFSQTKFIFIIHQLKES
jgi:hypothetical protein